MYNTNNYSDNMYTTVKNFVNQHKNETFVLLSWFSILVLNELLWGVLCDSSHEKNQI